MSPSARADAGLGEWGDERPRPLGVVGGMWLALVVGVPGALIGLAAGLASGPVPGALLAALYLGGLGAWIWGQGRLALRGVSAVPLGRGSSPRLQNLVAGLSPDLGREAPRLLRSPVGGPNAMICLARGPALVIPEGTEEALTRTELEALVVHCLLRSEARSLWRDSVAAALGPLAGPAGPHVGPREDALAAAVTRYPPGLAAALAKCEPRGGRGSVHWFSGRGPHHAPVETRIAALNDL